MFLALTAQSEYWDRRAKVLFLGTWCLRQDPPCDLDGVDFEILKTPWNDRRLFYEAAEYVDSLGECLLNAMAPILNDLHGVNFSNRYWRIVVGPWLLHLLHSAYDRHVHLCAAADRDPHFVTRLLIDDGAPPRDTMDFIDAIIGDDGNMVLISHLLRAMGRRDPEVAVSRKTGGATQQQTSSRTRSISRATLSFIGRSAELCAAVVGGRDRPSIIGLNIGFSQLLELLWTKRVRPFRLRAPVATAIPSVAMRSALEGRLRSNVSKGQGTAFEALLPGLIARFLPTCSLESYKVMRAAVGGPRRYPVCIASAISWYTDEALKLHAAEASEHGCSLVAIQHGGGYGQYLFSAPERHEIRISDRFLAWGWAEQNPERLTNIPHPNLATRARRPRKPSAGSALFVPTEHPRYLYRFHSTPVGSQWPAYFESQITFLTAFGKENRREIVFRSSIHDFGQGQYERIHHFFPDIAWDDGRPMDSWYEPSRLFIIDHLGTVILETLGRNIPTIAFWDPALWETRDAARPLFDLLRGARILWDSPRGAANHAREVLPNPESWWTLPEVQKARRAFAEVFALSNKEWASTWAERLLDSAGCRSTRPA